MKQFNIKILNRKLMIAIAIPFTFVYILGVLIYVIGTIEGDKNLLTTCIVAFIPFFIIFVLLNKACRKSYTVELNDSEIALKRNGLIEKSIMLKDVMFIRQSIQNKISTLILFGRGHLKPDIELLQVANFPAMQDILNALLTSGSYIKTQRIRMNLMVDEFINQSMIDSEASTIANLKSDKFANKRTKMILITVFIILLFGPIIAIVISKGNNNGESYSYYNDAVYFGDKKLNINPQEVDKLSSNLIKDSLHVYYKGEILGWADRASFKSLESVFYYDKNGVYYETSNLFSENQIQPLNGDYDHASFKSVGRFYYKDKNNLYKLNLSITKLDDNPLNKIEVEGIDLASFEGADENAYYWFKDKNRVYFGSDKKLKVANDIDAQTFETVTWEVAKDKNHVYYVTKNLKSDKHSATNYADYAILEGADAQTFEKIGYNSFRDKNTEWTIER